MKVDVVIGVAGVCGLWTLSALGQVRTIVADRANNSLWALADSNFNGTINEPGETIRFFSGANAAGTIAPSNPTCMAARCDRLVVFGDQGNTNIVFLRDLNNDGDAQDAGESAVVAGPGNASGVSLAFPSGAAFDAAGTLYVTNASNAFGNDAVYKFRDINSDGDFMDAGEISVYIGPGAFGGTSTNFSPQEICFVGSAMFLRNSNGTAPSAFGVYAARDLNNDGDADDPGEFTFYGPTAAAGVTATSGFAVEPDLARPGSLYYLQLATGGVDQLVRLTDLNNDGDAVDPGEAVMVWSTAEAGFTSIDILSRVTGEVYMSDNSGKRVIMLRDIDNDGLFTGAGERTNFYAATGATVGDLRQLADLPLCKSDMNGDGGITIDDLLAFLFYFDAGSICADVGGDGGLTIDDLLEYLAAFDFGC